MMLLVPMLLGAGVGAGVLLTYRGLRPRPLSLARALAGPSELAVNSGTGGGWQQRIASVALGILGWLGADQDPKLHQNLRIVGSSLHQHAYNKLVGAMVGLLAPNLVGGLLIAVGGAASPVKLAGLSLAAAAAGFVYPDSRLRREAERRRLAVRHGLSGYLDLVTIVIAGGGAEETALYTAARGGQGLAFDEIDRALDRARLTAQPAWQAFEQLADELGVQELREVSASLRLADLEGALLSESLKSKADFMRGRLLTGVEEAAKSANAKMLIPIAALAASLLLFVGFGAVNAIILPATTPQAPTSP